MKTDCAKRHGNDGAERSRRAVATCAATFCVALTAQFAAAKDVTIRSGVTDWTADASYVEEEAPVAGDNVIVPADTSVTLDSTDTASWELVESLTRIIPQADTSVLTVRVDDSSATFTTPFAIDTPGDFSDYRVRYTGFGELVKVGAGNLQLGGVTGRFLCSGRRLDYNTSITVKEGTLTLPQNLTTGTAPVHGPTVIEKGATIVGITVDPDYATSVWPSFAFFSLSGEGTLTSSGSRPFNVNSIHAKGTSVFAGKLSGTISGYISGDLVLTGTNSDNTGYMTVYYNKGSGENPSLASGNWWGGYISAVKIGMTGEASSIGTNGKIMTGNYGGGIVYLGKGEETDKTFCFGDGADSLWGAGFIDGGAYGGLVWSGAWTQDGGTTTKTSQMYITGSNETACVMSGKIEDITGNDSVKYPMYIIKRGTGTWRMADNSNRTGGGGYSIEDGTLQFESIAEKGTVCSLGTANNLTEQYSGRDIESHRVAYAYKLGTATTEGAMEFVGTNGSQCLTRPLVVRGKGRFKVSGSGRFAFSGVSPYDSDAVLTLDTERTSGVIFGGLHDGASGKLTVVKEGSGTVTLNTGCDFTGGLDIKSGKLVVEGTGRPVQNYRWFRWNITEKGVFCERYKDMGWKSGDWPNTPDLKMEDFAMFDENGKRIDKGLAYSDRTTSFDQMPAGTVAQETPKSIAAEANGNHSKITTYFDGGAGSVSGTWGGIDMRGDVWPFCRQNTPSQWFKLVVHLAEGAKAAASYDLAGFQGVASDAASREATAVRIDGSVDGVNWETVVENNSLEIPVEGARWYSNTNSSLVKVNGAAYYLQDHVGFPMRGTSTNDVAGIGSIAAPVSVASGATLEADGAVTLSALKLSATGNGTISGFTLAECGTLDVTNYKGRARVELPVTLTNVTGRENLENWTLSVNGQAKSKYRVKVGQDGKLYLSVPGLAFFIK